MDRYAQIINGRVDNVIESETDPDGTNGEWIACGNAGPGWTYNGTSFAPPPAPPEDPRLWWVDVGPFKDRLGMDALAVAASTHDACKAVIEMLNGRKYTDLKDPKVGTLLDLLIATNQPAANPIFPGSGPMTAAKKTAILTTPTVEAERHIKGL